jgi:hypothetical protein
MTSKPLLRAIIFLSIFIILFTIASRVLAAKFDYQSQTTTFYKQPEDSIDVLYFGASGFYRGVSPLIMWEEQGFTGYSRAIPSQQAVTAYYYFLESLKYQTPEVVVLDAYRLVNEAKFKRDEFAYRASYAPMRFSLLKLQSLFDVSSGFDPKIIFSYLVPFYRFHYRWRELTLEDWNIFNINKEDPYKGQGVTFEVYPITLPDNFMAPTDEMHGIKPAQREAYEKIIEICIERDIEILLVSMPRFIKADYFEYNAVSRFAEEWGLTLIDYNLPELMEEVGFDPLTDASDEHHVNSLGAEKFSSHLGDFIKTHYDLEDKRDDPDYEQWHADAEQLSQLLIENREKLGIPQ